MARDFGDTGEAGESFIGIFIAMGINTSPSPNSKDSGLLTTYRLSSTMIRVC